MSSDMNSRYARSCSSFAKSSQVGSSQTHATESAGQGSLPLNEFKKHAEVRASGGKHTVQVSAWSAGGALPCLALPRKPRAVALAHYK